MKKEVNARQLADFYIASEQNDANEARRLQRAADRNELVRIAPGLYVPQATPEEIEAKVQQNWQKIAGALVPGAVVSHISALSGGLSKDNVVILSHPTRFNKSITLPGVKLRLVQGPEALTGDFQVGPTGLTWSSPTRALLENIGSVGKNNSLRLGRAKVEEHLIEMLSSQGEAALNRIRDQSRQLAPALQMEKEGKLLDEIIGALLGTHSRGELRTKAGILVHQGIPLDTERQNRFEKLAAHLRSAILPTYPDVAPMGSAKINFSFLESYFSNYVEGTKFSIEEAEDIVLRNKLVQTRPKDSHDIIGVFQQALNTPYRDTLPATGSSFVEGLQARHAEMLKNRPEAQPGEIKTDVNFAGRTRFVEPAFVRGTLQEGSTLALSVPEGLARAIYYAFMISEVHPFVDGNGRLSRLLMNAELSRLGLCRIIIPTLFHPQYVDCARLLTNDNEPDGFVRALAKMATWSKQFDYSELPALIESFEKCNAFAESPIRFQLLNKDGTTAA